MTVIRQSGESYMHETVDKKVEIWKNCGKVYINLRTIHDWEP